MRAVVITGASTGIGEACALRLDRQGFRVFAGIRRPDDGSALSRKSSPNLMPVQLDVTDGDSIAKATNTVESAIGAEGLAGLVNNAGIVVGAPLEMIPLGDLRRQFEVNVIGQVAVTQAFLPLIRRGRGRIVNMGSIAGRAATPFLGPYCASKFALEAVTDALRMELQPWAIHVSIVEPGAIATPIWDKSRRAAAEREAASEGDVALYAEAVAGFREAVGKAEQRAIPAEAVADAVWHALTAKRPKTRYLVGTDAKIRAVLKSWLPDRPQDQLLSYFLQLPRWGTRVSSASN